MADPRTLAPLRKPQFRRIFASYAVSGVGDWLDYIALLTLVAYEWKSGPFALASLTVAMAAPWIVIAPFAGVWADRLPPRALMVGADLVRAGCVLAYLLAGNLAVLIPLVICKSAVSTLFAPAARKAVRLASADDELHAAVSLTAFVNQAAKIVGPALGGLLVATAGPRWAFAADAGTFVASAVILTGLRFAAAEDSAPAAGDRRFWPEFREGMDFLLHNRRLLVALAGVTATIFLAFTFDALSPLVMTELGVPSSKLGFAVAAIGLGAVAGTVFIGQWGDRIPSSLLMSASQLVAGSLVWLIGLAILANIKAGTPAWLAGMILIGASSAGIIISFGVTLQRETPLHLLGRVSTAADVVPTVMQLAAPPAGAAIAAGFGVGWVMVLAGGCLAVIGLATAVPSRRAMAAGPPMTAEADVMVHAAAVPRPRGPGPPPSRQQTSFFF